MMSKNENNVKKLTPKFLATIYIIVIVLCVTLISFFIILLSSRMQKNIELKAKAEEVIEKYKTEAKEHNNKNDPDYAEAYFYGQNVYIPSDDIVFEFEP